MYLTNKYTRWYKNIIAQAQDRSNHVGYFEKHHIVPKSLGGSNDNSNIIRLTAKEHFICHRLLTKMTTGTAKSKMCRAAWAMATLKKDSLKRVKVTSNTYSVLRSNLTVSIESRLKISQTLTGRPKSEAHKIATGLSIKGKRYPQGYSDERKLNMSAWQKGVPRPKIPCERCGKECSLMNYKKWHGSNCKNYVKIL